MIRDDIKAATIAAMKGGDKETTARSAWSQAAIKNRDIEARTGGAPKDDDALVTEVLQKMIKQRRESADIYRKNGREDRAAAEEAEIAVIERFLPAAAERGRGRGEDPRDRRRDRRRSMKDMGRVMALVKERLGALDRAARASGPGQGRALLNAKRAPPRVRRSPTINSMSILRRRRCAARPEPVRPVTPSITSS